MGLLLCSETTSFFQNGYKLSFAIGYVSGLQGIILQY